MVALTLAHHPHGRSLDLLACQGVSFSDHHMAHHILECFLSLEGSNSPQAARMIRSFFMGAKELSMMGNWKGNGTSK